MQELMETGTPHVHVRTTIDGFIPDNDKLFYSVLKALRFMQLLAEKMRHGGVVINGKELYEVQFTSQYQHWKSYITPDGQFLELARCRSPECKSKRELMKYFVKPPPIHAYMLGQTWIEPEEISDGNGGFVSLMTPNKGVRHSKRKGWVRFPDGVIGSVRLGDDRFDGSMAAIGWRGGGNDYMTGFVYEDKDTNEYRFSSEMEKTKKAETWTVTLLLPTNLQRYLLRGATSKIVKK